MSNATEVERQMAPIARRDGRRIMVHGGFAVQCVCVGRVVRKRRKRKKKWWWWWSCFRGLESGLQLMKPDGSTFPHTLATRRNYPKACDGRSEVENEGPASEEEARAITAMTLGNARHCLN